MGLRWGIPTIGTSNSEKIIIEASDFHLNRDKVRKKIVSSQSNGHVGLRCCALKVVEGLQN